MTGQSPAPYRRDAEDVASAAGLAGLPVHDAAGAARAAAGRSRTRLTELTGPVLGAGRTRPARRTT